MSPRTALVLILVGGIFLVLGASLATYVGLGALPAVAALVGLTGAGLLLAGLLVPHPNDQRGRR